MHAIDVAGLTVSRNGKVVLKDVEFHVAQEEIVALLGPSGAGKTTLIRAIIDLEPYVGSITIASDVRKNGLAYIDQDAHLLPWRTVRQNAAVASELRGRLNEGTLSGIDRLISQYQLYPDRNKLGTELSGGMEQRVAVIRAIAGEPGLLLCDEPFSAIDYVTRLELNDVFRANCHLGKISTFFVTHNIEEAILIADRILVLGRKPSRIIYNKEVKIEDGKRYDPMSIRMSPSFIALFNDLRDTLEDARIP